MAAPPAPSLGGGPVIVVVVSPTSRRTHARFPIWNLSKKVNEADCWDAALW